MFHKNKKKFYTKMLGISQKRKQILIFDVKHKIMLMCQFDDNL